MSKVVYDEKYSYEVFDDGYDISITSTGVTAITQRVPYDKPMDPNKSWEENAILQIQSIEEGQKPVIDYTRADLEFLALMLDIDLPSDEKGE